MSLMPGLMTVLFALVKDSFSGMDALTMQQVLETSVAMTFLAAKCGYEVYDVGGTPEPAASGSMLRLMPNENLDQKRPKMQENQRTSCFRVRWKVQATLNMLRRSSDRSSLSFMGKCLIARGEAGERPTAHQPVR
jgi:hypothetical protein